MMLTALFVLLIGKLGNVDKKLFVFEKFSLVELCVWTLVHRSRHDCLKTASGTVLSFSSSAKRSPVLYMKQTQSSRQ